MMLMTKCLPIPSLRKTASGGSRIEKIMSNGLFSIRSPLVVNNYNYIF